MRMLLFFCKKKKIEDVLVGYWLGCNLAYDGGIYTTSLSQEFSRALVGR